MPQIFLLAGLLSLFLLSTPSLSQSIELSPTPSWVEQLPINEIGDIPADSIQDGVFYRLLDNQALDAKQGQPQRFTRRVQVVANEVGVENVSQLNISYDPEFEQVRLHSLHISRDGVRLEKLSDARVSILQQEQELADNIVNGEHTLNIILRDIRAGDILEYSYSVVGQNPLYNDIFGAHYSLQWSAPVGENRIRVVTENPEGLHYRFLNVPDAKLEVKRQGSSTIYSYRERSIKARFLDGDVPNWYDPYPMLGFSQVSSWEDVNQWAHPLFESSIEQSEEIQMLAREIRAQSATPAEQLVGSLQYVQREIRYLGLEIGENSHVPYLASETLSRRYGDCKDKSVLLISLLRALGIEAQPALVNTKFGRGLIDYLPSPWLFDHAIVSASLDGKRYWLDPTRSPQQGPLSMLYQPDFRYALVLAADTHELIETNTRRDRGGIEVNETLDLNDPDGVLLTSETLYAGAEADYQNSRIISDGVALIRKNYIDYYRSVYGEVDVVKEVSFEQEEAYLRAEEAYRLHNFWEEDEVDQEKNGYLHPFNVEEVIAIPDNVNRTDPYALPHPVNRRHKVTLKLTPENWNFSNQIEKIENPYFTFQYEVTFDEDANLLHLSFGYESLADSVPAEDFANFIGDLKAANDLTDYGIYRDISAPPSLTEEPLEWLMDNWMFALLLVLAGGIVLEVVWWRIEVWRKPFTGESEFYPVSPGKFIYMNIVTMELFTAYWFYRNWRYIRDQSAHHMLPLARGVFSIFWYYPFYDHLAADRANREQRPKIIPAWAAIVLALIYFAASVLGRMSGAIALVSLFAFVAVLPLVLYVYRLNNANPQAQVYHSRIGLRQWLLVPIMMPLLLFIFGSEIVLTAPAEVVKGERLWRHDTTYMQRNNITRPDESIQYFYSDAVFLIRDDGNGVTDQGVFSYWKENGELNIETARFDEISNVETTWAKDSLANTLAEVHRKDDSTFVIFISAQGGGDKLFIRALNEGIRASREKSAPRTSIDPDGM